MKRSEYRIRLRRKNEPFALWAATDFGALRDIEQFKRFSVACHTLTWPNGANFAPEFLRECVAITAKEQLHGLQSATCQ